MLFRSYYDRQIYLNHKLIEERKLNLVEVMTRSSEFVVQMSGTGCRGKPYAYDLYGIFFISISDH